MDDVSQDTEHDSDDRKDSNESSNHNQHLADKLPATYTPASIFSVNVADTIDLSASVSQYLQTNIGSDSSSADVVSAQSATEPSEPNESSSTPSFYRQDPRRSNMSAQATAAKTSTATTTSETNATASNEDNASRPKNFEFFTRNMRDTQLDLPQSSVSEAPTSNFVGQEDSVMSNATYPSPPPTTRRSIYECSDTDDDSENNSNSRSRVFRGQSSSSGDDNEDSQGGVSTSRDKDMRISSILFDNDYANGDIDLRLPFKPVMANYIPATEIDASITSHPPMAYKVSHLSPAFGLYSV